MSESEVCAVLKATRSRAPGLDGLKVVFYRAAAVTLAPLTIPRHCSAHLLTFLRFWVPWTRLGMLVAGQQLDCVSQFYGFKGHLSFWVANDLRMNDLQRASSDGDLARVEELLSAGNFDWKHLIATVTRR